MGEFLKLLRKEGKREDLEFWVSELQFQAEEDVWEDWRIAQASDEELYKEIERLETEEEV